MGRVKPYIAAALTLLCLLTGFAVCAPSALADTPPAITSEPDAPEETAPQAGGETPAPEDPAEETDEPDAGILSNPVILWSGIGGLAVIALVITLVIIGKRKRAKTADSSTAPQTSETRGIQAVNIQNIGSRESQQDSFGITDVGDTARGVFAVVADGMGGTADGAEISRIVTSNMLQMFQASRAESENPAQLLLRMVSEAQTKARDYIEQHGNKISGSTIVSAIIKDGGVYFSAVGDSRICLLRGGALVQLNREHTCAARLDERAARGEISLDAARSDPQRDALTSYIGLDGQLQIDSNANPIPILSGDRLLLMSDGVFGTLSDEELARAAMIADVYEAGAAIEQAVKAKNKPNQDNFTAILLAF